MPGLVEVNCFSAAYVQREVQPDVRVDMQGIQPR
jgi:hypothetical protein